MILNRGLLSEIAEKFNIEINDEAFRKLEKYAEMLLETNKTFNLTAITEPDDVTVKHFADSLSILKYVKLTEGARVIDVGTGAGFPGLPILLLRPDIKMYFLDGTAKKLNFINGVLSETDAEGYILHMRAEAAGREPEYREKFDFVLARAVSDLSALSEYCLPLVKVGGSFVSMKSAGCEDEIQAAEKAISALGGEIQSDNVFDLVENTPRRIIVIRKKSQTPTKYPRASAKIAKNPIK